MLSCYTYTFSAVFISPSELGKWINKCSWAPEGRLHLLSCEILTMSCCSIIPAISTPWLPSKYPNWFVICQQIWFVSAIISWNKCLWSHSGWHDFDLWFLSFTWLVLIASVFERLSFLSYQHLKALVLGTVLPFGTWIWGGSCWQRQLLASFPGGLGA